jgi:hypothetical protein
MLQNAQGLGLKNPEIPPTNVDQEDHASEMPGR